MDLLEQFFSYGYTYIVGVDEAGRGPLAGPVVAAAIAVTEPLKLSEIKDSKALSPEKREELDQLLRESGFVFSYGVRESYHIDREGISQASKMAMVEAVEKLGISPKETLVLIDGPWKIPTGYPQLPIVKGDAKVPLISAASILAKAKRDRIMNELELFYPGYDFSKNKGYPTRKHLEQVKRLGPSPIHRRSFKGCRKED